MFIIEKSEITDDKKKNYSYSHHENTIASTFLYPFMDIFICLHIFKIKMGFLHSVVICFCSTQKQNFSCQHVYFTTSHIQIVQYMITWVYHTYSAIFSY